MKKITSVVMSVLMVLALLVVPNNTVYANTVAVSVSASSVDIGDSVTVTVGVPSGITAQIDVAYSSDLLSFSNCSTTANNNGSSVTMNLGSFSTPTATLTFAAKASGTATFTVTPVTAGSEETAEEVPLAGASATVTIANQVTTAPSTPSTPSSPGVSQTPQTPALSGDNKLGYLKVSSGKLSPTFHPDTTKYTVTVGYDVTKVTVSATPSSASAVVTAVSGGSDLKVGENKITITVKAENGVTKNYTITVTRKEQQTASSEVESESSSQTQEPVEKFEWNGSVLEFKDNVPAEIVPVDFVKTTKMLHNQEVPVLEFKDGMLTVVYLTDENGDNNLYVYDAVANDVYPFVSIGDEETYVMVLRPDDATAPAGYLACTLSIEGKGVVSAYQFNTEELLEETAGLFGAETFYGAEAKPTDFYLMYCLNQDGEYGWYQYDVVEGTFQRYSAGLFTASINAKPEVEETLPTVEALKQQMLIILIVAAVVVIILLIVIIILAVKLSKKEDDEYYDDEDEDLYIYDDSEEVEYIEETEESDDEVEVEFYEMQVEDDKEDEIEIEFYEMPATSEELEIEDDEVEIEFYEMEPEIPDMEDLLVKEVMEEKPISKPELESVKVEQPKRVVTPIEFDDDDDTDLEFIDLD